MVQLSSKVTFKHVQDMSGMHVKRVHASTKPRDKAVAKLYLPHPFLSDASK